MNLFAAIADLLKPAPPPDPAVLKALEHIAGQLDPLLKSVPQLGKRLQEPLHHALGYCEGLVAALPGPLDISRHHFASEPMIHALFATGDDIQQMLGRSQPVRDFLACPQSRDSDYFYAMLAARRNERRQFGMEQHGEIIYKDVPQTVVYFSDHILLEPCHHLEHTLESLRCRGLESLLHTFATHVELLRHEREGLRAGTEAERIERDILLAGHKDEEALQHTRILEELSARLREHVESLTPEHLLDTLADYLRAPEKALRLTPVSVTLDQSGVVQGDNGAHTNSRTLDFAELTSRDRRLHIALLARISREEAEAAVAEVCDQQHRFMLI